MIRTTLNQRIGITMGDAAGIGPEILLKAWQENRLSPAAVVIGDYEILALCQEKLGFQIPLKKINHLDAWTEGKLNVLDLACLQPEQLKIGQINRLSGKAAADYVIKATQLVLDGSLAAIVTLPMNKEATRLSLPNFSGHTELIAELCQQTDYTMMLTSNKLTVSHVSTHVSMSDAIQAITQQRVLKVIELTNQALSSYIEKPRLAVAGLNPHAGEQGAFGQEEINEIAPAIVNAQERGILCEGPVAPDTVFLKASRGAYDAVVCMYHDQGHIPMKLLDFEGGVNVTLGLKVIRTSVDHGTAFDIAWQGKASPDSLVAAYNLASQMCGQK